MHAAQGVCHQVVARLGNQLVAQLVGLRRIHAEAPARRFHQRAAQARQRGVAASLILLHVGQQLQPQLHVGIAPVRQRPVERADAGAHCRCFRHHPAALLPLQLVQRGILLCQHRVGLLLRLRARRRGIGRKADQEQHDQDHDHHPALARHAGRRNRRLGRRQDRCYGGRATSGRLAPHHRLRQQRSGSGGRDGLVARAGRAGEAGKMLVFGIHLADHDAVLRRIGMAQRQAAQQLGPVAGGRPRVARFAKGAVEQRPHLGRHQAVAAGDVWRNGLVALDAIRIIACADAAGEIGRHMRVGGPAAVGMDAKVQQLKNHHRQRKAVLRRFRAGRHALALILGRQVVAGELLCLVALALALDGKTVAVEHGDVQGIAIETQVDRFQVDHIMLLLVQRRQHAGQVGRQRHLGAQAYRQAGRARLAFLQHLFQLGRVRHVQQRHHKAEKAALLVVHGSLRPGDLHVALAVFQFVRQLGGQLQHGAQLAPVGGQVDMRMVELGYLRGRTGQQIHAAGAAALDQLAEYQAALAVQPDGVAWSCRLAHAHARKAISSVLSSPVIWCVRGSSKVCTSACSPSTISSMQLR